MTVIYFATTYIKSRQMLLNYLTILFVRLSTFIALNFECPSSADSECRKASPTIRVSFKISLSPLMLFAGSFFPNALRILKIPSSFSSVLFFAISPERYLTIYSIRSSSLAEVLVWRLVRKLSLWLFGELCSGIYPPNYRGSI